MNEYDDKTFTSRKDAEERLDQIFSDHPGAYVDVLVSNEGCDGAEDRDHPDYIYFQGYAAGSDKTDQIHVAYGTSGKDIMVSVVE